MQSWSEPGLCKPLQLANVDASSLWPGIRDRFPNELKLDDASSLQRFASGCASFTRQLNPDGASGNILRCKRRARDWEEKMLLAGLEGRMMLRVDLCQFHSHQRGKLALGKGLYDSFAVQSRKPNFSLANFVFGLGKPTC